MSQTTPASSNNLTAVPSSAGFLQLNYGEDTAKISRFLEEFKAPAQVDETVAKARKGKSRRAAVDEYKYIEQIKQVSLGQRKEILIELEDIQKFFPNDALVNNIIKNTRRYHTLFCRAIDPLFPAMNEDINEESDPIEVLINLRKQRDRQREQNSVTGVESDDLPFPPALTRKYVLNFKALPSDTHLSVREVKPELLGHLVTVRAMVTRVSNVKPLAVVLAYSCDKCGSEIFQEVAGQAVNPIVECQSAECKRNNTKGSLQMLTRGSKFLKFQEVKIQELTDQVPMGHIPRTMNIHLYESLARQVNPGDTIILSGIYLPMPYSGFRAIRAGLLTDTFLEAHHIIRMKEQYHDMTINSETRRKLAELKNDTNLYNRLARSIAPEIWGHEDVKKALLLQLVGGVTKETPDGMRIRGDLNICLMGDPGVAKSQLLKHICKVAPRSVYTTGRGSSGVGLTATVMKDPVTDELILEGGALVLADNGIACIDEFDKMDESDRTAIHEVMEQQTISVSKAGITTTLNARTSILAAANPLYGRYNPDRKATENINLPAALLSRFDLLFLILDKPTIADDLRLAKHVTYVHIHNTHPTIADDSEVIDTDTMKKYIALARTFHPIVPQEVADYIVQLYTLMREKAEETADFQYTSARTLLSIVRVATALARLRFSETVDMSDVDEATRLSEVSKASLHRHSGVRKKDILSSIFDIITTMSKRADGSMERELNYGSILERVKAKGYSEEKLKECIEWYENNGMWQSTAKGSKLAWVLIDEDI